MQVKHGAVHHSRRFIRHTRTRLFQLVSHVSLFLMSAFLSEGGGDSKSTERGADCLSSEKGNTFRTILMTMQVCH